MDTVLKYDKVVLIKELDETVKKVGEVYEVASILDDRILLRDSKTRVAIGVVSFEDFDKHFVKKEQYKGWTSWQPITGFDGQTDAVYRTNRRRVQVKFLTNNVRAESCCCKLDDFNLFFGIQMAYLRCLNKCLEKQKEEYKKNLDYVSYEIAENNDIIRKMVESLNV